MSHGEGASDLRSLSVSWGGHSVASESSLSVSMAPADRFEYTEVNVKLD